MSKDPQQTAEELENYWSQRYIDQSTGWDLGAISTPIRKYVDQLTDKTIKILIPGAGNGYEAEYLYKAGFTNTYIMDISELPLLNFRKRVPDFPKGQMVQADFFSYQDQFDVIIEQTFFSSFPPVDNNSENYVSKMHGLLKPGGKLIGLWFNITFTGNLTNRPFGSTQPEYTALFETHFTLKTFEGSHNSVSDRAGQELFGILEKKETAT